MAKLSEAKIKNAKITLTDGVERELRFTLNAMAELEDRYGSVEKAFEALEENSIKALRLILWAGLMSDDPDLTEKQVGDLIDLGSMSELMESLGEAFNTNMPDTPAKTVKTVKAVEAVEDPKA